MHVTCIIPDRGDRPQFMANCLRMMRAQTHKTYEIIHVDTEPKDDECDITKRYRLGYKWASEMKTDVIAFIENDDWYSMDYLEHMLYMWDLAGQPDLFGTSQTIYYHLGLRKYMTMFHETRSNAMSMLIKPGMEINWPLDHDPYTDAWLWMRDNGIKTKKIFTPKRTICMGMKHGVGKSGGEMHTTHLSRYVNNDLDHRFLKSTVDVKSYAFYSSLKIEVRDTEYKG